MFLQCCFKYTDTGHFIIVNTFDETMHKLAVKILETAESDVPQLSRSFFYWSRESFRFRVGVSDDTQSQKEILFPLILKKSPGYFILPYLKSVWSIFKSKASLVFVSLLPSVHTSILYAKNLINFTYKLTSFLSLPLYLSFVFFLFLFIYFSCFYLWFPLFIIFYSLNDN